MENENIKKEITQPQPTENFPIKKQKPWLMIILIILLIISLGTVGVFAYTNYLLKKQIQTEEDSLINNPIQIETNEIQEASPTSSTSATDETKDFTYSIEECEGTAEMLSPEEEKLQHIEISNQSLKFEQRLSTYCNASEENLKLSLHKENQKLEIRETFTADVVTKCVCPIRIKGQINNLEVGEYRLSVIFENGYTHQTDIIDERVVKIQ